MRLLRRALQAPLRVGRPLQAPLRVRMPLVSSALVSAVLWVAQMAPVVLRGPLGPRVGQQMRRLCGGAAESQAPRRSRIRRQAQ